MIFAYYEQLCKWTNSDSNHFELIEQTDINQAMQNIQCREYKDQPLDLDTSHEEENRQTSATPGGFNDDFTDSYDEDQYGYDGFDTNRGESSDNHLSIQLRQERSEQTPSFSGDKRRNKKKTKTFV